jgi:hypothetical protein
MTADALHTPVPVVRGDTSLPAGYRHPHASEEARRIAEQRLIGLRASTSIAAEPDRAWVDGWLHRSYLRHWARS